MKERGGERARHAIIGEELLQLAALALLRLRTERERHTLTWRNRLGRTFLGRAGRIWLGTRLRRGAVVNVHVAVALDLDIDPATGVSSRLGCR